MRSIATFNFYPATKKTISPSFLTGDRFVAIKAGHLYRFGKKI